MSAQKELRELVRAVEERGFTVEPTGGGHQKILYKGVPVQQGDPDDRSTWKPVTLPSTPSDSRWRENTVSMLIRAHVLEEDPFRAGQAGLSDDEVEARANAREQRAQRQEEAGQEREAQAEADRAEADPVNQVRERAKAILEPLGVWRRRPDPGLSAGTPRRTIGEVARIAYSLAEKNPDLAQPPPATKNAAEVAIKKFFEGEGGVKNVAWIESLLDDLEAADDPIRRYFQLVREELGIEEGGPQPEEPAVPAPGPPPGPEPLAVEDEDDERVRDLRSRLRDAEEERRELEKNLDAARKETEKAKADAEKASEDAADAEAAAALLTKDLERTNFDAAAFAAKAADLAQAEPKVPELAFEVLAEMIGQHVTVAPEEADNLEGVLAMLNEKKERATALAKRVAALELGIADDDE